MLNLTKGRTSIFVAHRLTTAMQCDEIVVLNGGKVVEQQGTHSELLDQKGPYSDIWGAGFDDVPR